MSADRPSAWDAALIFFPLAAIVAALPAATNLFSDPLTGLLAGLLFARRKLPEVLNGTRTSWHSDGPMLLRRQQPELSAAPNALTPLAAP